MAELVVKIVEARDLPAGDSNGKSDPYVKVKFGDHEKKTATVKKTLNPKWNSTFVFKKAKQTDTLALEVMDHDTFSRDDKLGKVSVYLDQAVDNEPTDKWVRLDNGGELHLVITWYPEGEKRGKQLYEEYQQRQQGQMYQGQSNSNSYGGVQQTQMYGQTNVMYGQVQPQQQVYGQPLPMGQPVVQQQTTGYYGQVQQQPQQQMMSSNMMYNTTTTTSSNSNSNSSGGNSNVGTYSYDGPEKELDKHYGDLTSTNVSCSNPETITSANFSENEITKVDGLKKFTNLRKISLHTNNLVRLKGIQDAPYLVEIDAHNNDIESAKYLEQCRMLEVVDLHSNYLGDQDSIMALADECPNLRYLDIGTNNFSKRQVKKIKKYFASAAPQCQLVFTQEEESDEDSDSDSD